MPTVEEMINKEIRNAYARGFEDGLAINNAYAEVATAKLKEAEEKLTKAQRTIRRQGKKIRKIFFEE
jgi:hypothetical protein